MLDELLCILLLITTVSSVTRYTTAVLFTNKLCTDGLILCSHVVII